VTFNTRHAPCTPVHINDVQIHVRYLALHLDRRLTWHPHIFTKCKQLWISLTKMHWLLGHKSKLSISNKLLIYKTILKPIWTYGIQLWGTTSNSNIAILERFQSKDLRLIVNALWYVPNCHPQGPPNTFSKRRNRPLQLPLRSSPPYTHQWTYCHTHRAANPQAYARYCPNDQLTRF
jgi:hypothetical protein